jgi:hypothetical protein
MYADTNVPFHQVEYESRPYAKAEANHSDSSQESCGHQSDRYCQESQNLYESEPLGLRQQCQEDPHTDRVWERRTNDVHTEQRKNLQETRDTKDTKERSTCISLPIQTQTFHFFGFVVSRINTAHRPYTLLRSPPKSYHPTPFQG